MTKKKQTFEEMISELEKIVASLEENNLSLSDSLSQFEKGINLTKRAKEELNTAEQRIQILTEEDQDEFISFEPRNE